MRASVAPMSLAMTSSMLVSLLRMRVFSVLPLRDDERFHIRRIINVVSEQTRGQASETQCSMPQFAKSYLYGDGAPSPCRPDSGTAHSDKTDVPAVILNVLNACSELLTSSTRNSSAGCPANHLRAGVDMIFAAMDCISGVSLCATSVCSAVSL